ncbi:CoA transferase [Gammaproteobacteria bacterium]|nr:CoA transferase [Gammaproteobacteria bacterium]
MTKPLEGILVVALEQAVAGPYCTSRLADAGARVIKIERPAGDFARGYDDVVSGESAYFVWLNRGKESIILDIKKEADAALLHRMISKADVFVQNLVPGAAARSGFGSNYLRKQQPKLITCDISGYASEGPSAKMKAYDMLVQAEIGLSSITGSSKEPGRVGVSVCDIAAGMYAHSAILLALYELKNTGAGKAIKTSLFDGMTVPLLHHDYGGKAPERVGLRHPSVAPYASFETKDGEFILISIQNNREWEKFSAEILAKPELSKEGPFKDNMSRVKNVVALEKVISNVFRLFTRSELSEKLLVSEIAFARVNSVADFSLHGDLRRMDINTPNGPVSIPSPPAQTEGEATSVAIVPAMGEHTKLLRSEFEA